MAYRDIVLANSPVAYYELDESSGTTLVDSSGSGKNGTFSGSPSFDQTSLLSDGTGTSVKFNNTNATRTDFATYAVTSLSDTLNFSGDYSIDGWFKWDTTVEADSGGAYAYVFERPSAYKIAISSDTATGTYKVFVYMVNRLAFVTVGTNYLDGQPHYFCYRESNDGVTASTEFYIDDTLIDSATDTSPLGVNNTNDLFIACRNGSASYNMWVGWVDDVAFYPSRLTDQDMADRLATGGSGADAQSIPLSLSSGVLTSAQSVPMSLTDLLTTAAQSIPLTLDGVTNTAAQTVPLSLSGIDATHITGTSARWSFVVTLGGVDISDRIAGSIDIDHEEDSSGTCRVVYMPSTGSIDPENYENQPLTVDFVGIDTDGSTLYTVRRYTGTVERATWDPRDASVTIEATTDLQGRLEAMDTATIDSVVGGYWSAHVFDETADGYQYALDRLSTIPSEMHIDRHGNLVVVPLAAKTTADLTITDSARFNDTLSVRRASRRDLLTKYRATLDFRFTRLRHREVSVRWLGAAFCSWANYGWAALPRNMVQQAADGSSWTRVSDIVYQPYPPPGTYCTPLRGWTGDFNDDLCLGATWTAARRWAQTVTEVYTIEVDAPDLAESVGTLMLEEDYGIEATYDADEYEGQSDFSGPPSGATYSADLGDWYIEGTEAEYDGRAAMETAQECVIARGRAEILKRARRNVVSFAPRYRPDIDLAQTIQVTATGLTAKGKVRRIAESYDTDTGRLDQTVELAISRHGGSGLAVDDDIAAADAPALETETLTSRYVALGLYLGGLSSSPPDSDTFNGYVVNVDPNVRTGSNLYDRRFVVQMPEIEDAARQATELQQSASYEVAVPEDTLTFEA